MSEAYDPTKPNPFSDGPPPQVLPFPNVPAGRPPWLTAIAITAIVGGVLGLMSGGTKVLNLAFGAQMQAMFSGFGAPNDEFRQAQEEMNAALLGEVDRFLIPNTILAITQLTLSIVLIYAGARTLQLHRLGRLLLVTAFGLLLIYEVAQLITFTLMQMGMMPIMELHMSRVMRSAPGPQNQGIEQFSMGIARFSMIAGIIIAAGWSLIKMVFYGLAFRYLRRADIVALFQKPEDQKEKTRRHE